MAQNPAVSLRGGAFSKGPFCVGGGIFSAPKIRGGSASAPTLVGAITVGLGRTDHEGSKKHWRHFLVGIVAGRNFGY